MNAPNPGPAGATRACPHCRETILASSTVCPACKHHLRFGQSTPASATAAVVTPLKVEGSIRNPSEGAWEYSMVLTIRNERGEEITRKLVGVGAMQPDEQRSFTLSVEMTQGSASGKRTRH